MNALNINWCQSLAKFSLPANLTTYTFNLISVQSTGRTRSSSLFTRARPSVSLSLQITNRSFKYASPHLWNQLPSFRQPHSIHSYPGSPHPRDRFLKKETLGTPSAARGSRRRRRRQEGERGEGCPLIPTEGEVDAALRRNFVRFWILNRRIFCANWVLFVQFTWSWFNYAVLGIGDGQKWRPCLNCPYFAALDW